MYRFILDFCIINFHLLFLSTS